MPRRKIQRSPEEEEEYQRMRWERNSENQRLRRQKLKNKNISGCSENLAGAIRVDSLSQSEVLHVNNKDSSSFSRGERTKHYEARQKGLFNVDTFIDSESNTISENYLGEINELCIHCNTKHFM